MMTRHAWAGLVLVMALGCGDDDVRRSTDAGTDGSQLDSGGDSGMPLITNAANNPFPCLNAMPSESFGVGFYECDNGLMVRPAPATCPASAAGTDECQRDADCGAERFCRCGKGPGAQPWEQAVNQCGGGSGDDCRSDRDCTAGFHCAHVIIGYSDWAIWHMRCQQPADECATADDCLEGLDAGSVPMSYLACQANEAGRYCNLNGW